ncbi:FMN-binding protein [Nakamurella panacisegetis]|uniref:FMN-binding protein n=1 Tax=Nakamurella panacisegetis TaxID=1090615 RepID=UPI0012FE7A84
MITGRRITRATAIQYPSGGHSSDISSFAVPQLQSEVISAQSAAIQGVSGATYTSQGFQSSLQSALDAAHFGG